MIKDKCFNKEWINNFKKKSEYKGLQSHILEKMIHALYLLILLKKNGLNFVFKGGTSLILLKKENNRFSIDIDIICNEKRDFLEDILSKIVTNSAFINYVLDSKRSYKSGVPKAHYKFEFESVYDRSQPSTIVLDILRDKHVYPQITEILVDTKWIEVDENINVTVPTIDSITGDKLTAFAPNTIGIPYEKNGISFSMEICKQMFDLSSLFSKISDLEIVNESFQNLANKEIQYRSNKFKKENIIISPDEILKDTIRTCILIASKGRYKGQDELNKFYSLNQGMSELKSYLITGNFRWEDAVAASSKIVYLTSKLLARDFKAMSIYSGEDVKKLTIINPIWKFLNKLKKQPDKSSFFYWHNSLPLLEEHLN